MSNFSSDVDSGISALVGIIGAENVSDMQRKIGDVIVSQCERDLEDYGRYILYPPDFQDELNDAYNKVSKKISKMYTDAMLDVAQKSVDKFKEIAMQGFDNMKGEEIK